jgi:N-acetylneuraminic acid mutarotase
MPFNVLPAQAAETNSASSWSTMSPMPTARGGFGIAVVNGKIYAIGGLNTDNQALNTVEEYNPLTNEWSSKMSMPTPRTGFATAVYDNKIYAIGGTVGNGYVGNNEVYDSVTNTWSTKASMPTPRADLSANVVNDKMYLIGGKRYSGQDPFYKETDVNECYDPTTDSWSTKASLPTAVQGYGSAVVDNKIYVIGGSKTPTSGGTSTIINNNQVYDTQTDQWTIAAPLSSLSSYGAAGVTEGYLAPKAIYYIGGFTGGDFSDQTKVYTLSNNSWSYTEAMPTARAYLGLAVVNDALYAIGGFDGTVWLNANEQYTPVGYGSVAPKVHITSPENKTYQSVSLAFTVNRGTQWLGYSLDGKTNVTITSETKLSGLSQGAHQIVIYSNDSAGNMGTSNTVNFSIDSRAPTIVLMQPANQSYDSTDVQLIFTIDEANATLSYSLDGQPNILIIGNMSLVALSNGAHRVTVFVTDNVGNIAEETVYFNIAPFPWLAVVAVLTIIIIVAAAGYLVFKRRKTGADTTASSSSGSSVKQS